MARKKIPTAAEVREYREKEDARLKYCLDNHVTYEIGKDTFPGENIWCSAITLPLLEAAEAVGVSNEEIWPLCRKIASFVHMPLNQKEFDRMIPFSENQKVVDTVLQMLQTYIPPFDKKYWVGGWFDSVGYVYSHALISLSEHRIEDCERQLWTTADQFIADEPKHHRCWILVRNLNMVKNKHPYVLPMIARLEEAIAENPEED